MNTPALRTFSLCLASFLILVGLGACREAKPIGKDPRLNEIGKFNLNWPPTATTLEAAVAETEAKIGPGIKRPDGTVEWTARKDPTHCNRIQLKNEGGKLSSSSETLLEAHPNYQACISGK